MYTAKGGLRHEDHASLLHERLFVRCAHASALRSCAREFISPSRSHRQVLSPSSFDSRSAVDDVSSHTSRSESFLFLALPSLSQLLPSRLPPLPAPRCHSLPLSWCSLSLSPSFTLAVLTNAGYNSIVGHDPQAALTPKADLQRQIEQNRIISA